MSNCANLRRLLGTETVALDVVGHVRGRGFDEVAIGFSDAERTGCLPSPHRDPFDRMLTEQVLARNLVFISTDSVFDRYDVDQMS